MAKLTEAQKRAQTKWDQENKNRKRYLSKKSACKSFILKTATESDLALVDEWLNEAKNNLKKT